MLYGGKEECATILYPYMVVSHHMAHSHMSFGFFYWSVVRPGFFMLPGLGNGTGNPRVFRG
jgi:hypothetical protein